jgi:hypothetical protein
MTRNTHYEGEVNRIALHTDLGTEESGEQGDCRSICQLGRHAEGNHQQPRQTSDRKRESWVACDPRTEDRLPACHEDSSCFR